MKTTIDLPEALLGEAKRLAARRKTTVKALVEASLRRTLQEHERPEAFRLRDARFAGTGLQPGLSPASWDRLRELAYGDWGG